MIRLIQVFLSSSSQIISEVSQDSDSGELFCTCPGYLSRNTCRHLDEVERRIEDNDGAYPMAVSTKATQEIADEAIKSEEAFRKFVLNYGRIDIL